MWVCAVLGLYATYNGSLVGRDGSVGIATRYGKTVRGSNPGCGGVFFAHVHVAWGRANLLCSGYRIFPGGKRDGAWCCPPTSSFAEVKERVELHLYSPSGPSWSVIG
jgi:hypothetical protein